VNDEEVTLEAEGSLEVRSAADREIDLRIVPWDVPARTLGGMEVFRRGAFAGTDPSRVTLEAYRHGGPLVGRGLRLEEREDGAYLTGRVSAVPDGDALLTLADDRVLQDASVVFHPVPGGSRRLADGTIERTRVDLRRVAILERGAYPGASVIAVRSEDAPVPEITADAPLTEAQFRAIAREIMLEAAPPVITAPAPAPVEVRSLPATFAEWYTAVYEDGDTELARAALVDHITGDVPEIVRPAWLSEIIGFMAQSRAVVDSFGRGTLPASGLSIEWPTFDGDYDGFVGEQTTQKTEVTSKKVALDIASTTIKTYAGGADIAWQLIRRSDPAFMAVYQRVLAGSYAKVTDTAFGAAITGNANLGHVDFAALSDTTKPEVIHAALVEASSKVDDATGTPATFVLAASDVWLKLAKIAGLMPPVYGTSNLYGTSMASSLQVSISGLPVRRAKNLADGTILVSNNQTADWLETGPSPAQQDIVAKLGTDFVLWGMGAPRIIIPAGIVELSPAAP
jgi:phage head maturation protease